MRPPKLCSERLSRSCDRGDKKDLGVTDGPIGQRTFNYDNGNNRPWRHTDTQLPAFYGSRVMTRLYDSGGVVGRYKGFQLGTGASPTSDLEQIYGFTSGGRFETLQSKRDSGAADRTFRYAYLNNSALVSALSIDGAHPFTVTRGYESNRNLLTSIDSKWSTTSQTRYDFTYNSLYQRETAKQSGSAFADYGDSTFHRYTYNARGELTAASGAAVFVRLRFDRQPGVGGPDGRAERARGLHDEQPQPVHAEGKPRDSSAGHGRFRSDHGGGFRQHEHGRRGPSGVTDFFLIVDFADLSS